MPNTARVLIYQANRAFNEDELTKLNHLANEFLNGWRSHDMELNACIEIRHNRFIIICIDESFESVSGCSLDKSVKFIKDLEQEFKVSLFDRMHFAYKENEVVKSCNRTAFEELIAEGKINENTIVFNNLVANKSELATNWEVAFKDSWHSNLFPIPSTL